MKKILFCLSLLAALIMAGTAFAGPMGQWQPVQIIIGAADTYVWQPFNNRNESYIFQNGRVSTAMVLQLNDQSFSWINQTTKHGSDFASVVQNSPCCYLSYSIPVWGPRGWHNKTINLPLFTSDLFQNTSWINQTGHHGKHSAFVYQWGDANYSDIKQTGKNDYAALTQYGTANDSFIRQDGKGPNVAEVVQIGDLNYSDILQDGGINTASVTQSGFGNDSYVSQTGFGYGCYSISGKNTAVVNQMGYMNESAIVQTGGGIHSAYVTQANFCFTASLPSCAGAGCGH
jgi:hypothetical protein